jgi:hypothetical protein
MPQVPYSPYPNVQEEAAPAAGPRVDTPGAAFGENIGQAIERFGGQVGQAGNELFGRAIALQDLDNENTARERVVGTSQKMAIEQANFDALQGKERSDALMGHLQTLESLRQEGAQGLNLMARRLYHAEVASLQNRFTAIAAGRAGEALKDYTIKTYESAADLDIKQGEDDPNFSPDAQRAKITEKVTQAAMLRAGVDDPNNPIIKDAVMKAVSQYDSNRLIGLAKIGKVDQAMEELKTAKLTDPDFNRVSSALEGKGTALYASNIVNKIMADNRNDDGTYKKTAQQMQDEVAKQAAKYPELPRLETEAKSILDHNISMGRWAATQDNVDTNKQLTEAIVSHNVHTVQDLEAVPGIDQVLSKLDSKSLKSLQSKINQVNDSFRKYSNKEVMTQLNGLGHNDVERFLNVDPTDPKWGLSYDDIKQIQNQQAQLAKKPGQDPRVVRALALLRRTYPVQLQDLGLMTRDRKNPDDYDHFTGAAQEWLQEFLQDNKRPASDEEVQDKMGPQLFRTHTVKGYIWNSDEPIYRQWTRPTEIPEDFRRKITDEVVGRGGAVPSDQQLLQAYTRKLFNDLYAGDSGGGSTIPKR